MAGVDLNDVKELLSEICEDSGSSKNIKERLNSVTKILESEEEDSIKINKALHEIDEIVNDNNMQQFTRTQIWNVASLLETKK